MKADGNRLIAHMEFFAEMSRGNDFNAAALRVAFVLLYRHMNGTTGRCNPSIAVLVQETGLSERGVRYALRELEQSGWWQIVGGSGAGRLINLARRYDWHVALCSFENRPTDHSVKLFEKYLGVPFRDGSIRRMGEGDLRMALDWARPRFFFIRAEDDAPPTVDWILERARAAVLRYGSNVLVIDPYNEIEHRRPDNMSETEFVSQSLGKVKRFAENHALHVFFVAHPAKPAREAGKPAVPGLYDISGSAHWANKADLGFVVHRPNFEGDEVQIHVLKVRHKWVGEPGQVSLRFDRITGRYSEPVQSPADGARGYRDD